MGKKERRIPLDALIVAILDRDDSYNAGQLYSLRPEEVKQIFDSMTVLPDDILLAKHQSALQTAEQAQAYARTINRAA